jgi:hypothetical protein
MMPTAIRAWRPFAVVECDAETALVSLKPVERIKPDANPDRDECARAAVNPTPSSIHCSHVSEQEQGGKRQPRH